jgi:hypothetical protein
MYYKCTVILTNNLRPQWSKYLIGPITNKNVEVRSLAKRSTPLKRSVLRCWRCDSTRYDSVVTLKHLMSFSSYYISVS